MMLPSGKRLKWEPAAAMLLVLGLGIWLAVGPVLRPHYPLRHGAIKIDLRDGDSRGVLEYVPNPAPGEPSFRVFRQGEFPVSLTGAEVRLIFGGRVYNQAVEGRRNWAFRLLNITSWYNLVWIGIGFGGQLLFSGRMVLQWLISERRRESVVTESFWWFSLIGSVTLLSYFIWRGDPIGMLGQATGTVIYARNLRLIHKHKRRAARAAASAGQGHPP